MLAQHDGRGADADLPLPATATVFTVRQAVQELLANAWHYRRDRMETLPQLVSV